MRRYLLLLPLLGLWPGSAEALSVRDILELSRAGLGDDVLLALIEVDPSVFPIDAATLKTLKGAGVSERVIVAMVRSARVPPAPLDPGAVPADFPTPPEPQVIVIDHHDAPIIREVPVVYPVYVPVYPRSVHARDVDDQGPRVPAHATVHRDGSSRDTKSSEPVYWGWGGTLRPDAWKPK